MDSTKEDMHLLGQLYTTMHVRKGNSDRLFEVENADCPPPLSKHGVLRGGQKSDLVSCLEVDCPSAISAYSSLRNTLTLSYWGYHFSVIFAITKCGFHLELETNCGTFQLMTSAVRLYDVFRQDKSSSRIPCPDSIR